MPSPVEDSSEPSSAPRPSLARRLAIHAAVVASYTVLALIHLRPLAFRFAETIPRGERMDVLLHGWIINWTAHQLLRAPWALFQANIFFPHPDALAYTEHMVPEALPVVPIQALTRDPVLTYNVAYLLTFVLGGWGTFLLVRRLTGNPWAAWVAGAFACWFPAKRWSLAHVNTISVHGVPFALLALHRLLERPTMLRGLAAGVMVALACLVSAYYVVYLPLLLALWVPLAWWAQAQPVDRRRILALGVAGLTSLAIAVPILMPYLQTYGGGDEPARSYDLQVAGAADVAELFILDSLFWSRFLLPDALEPLTTPFFPGAVALALMLMALFGKANRGTGSPGSGATVGTAPEEPDRTPDAGEPPGGHGAGTTRDLRAFARAGGYLVAAAFALVTGSHLVAHHRATAAFQEGPDAPVVTMTVLAVCALALLVAGEQRSFPAVVRSLWRRLLTSPRMARVYAAVAGFALLIALGPRLKFFGYEGPLLPYHWIYYGMPGASALRAPYRAGILGQAFVAVVIGFGAAWLLARLSTEPTPGDDHRVRVVAGRRAPALVSVALVLLMTAETTGNPLPLRDLPDSSSGVYGWLAEQPGDFGILEWPIARDMDGTAPGQWLSTLHWKRRVTGHNGSLPDDIRDLHAIAREWPPGVPFLDRVRDEFPVRYVVVDLDRFDRAMQREFEQDVVPYLEPWWRLERRFDNHLVFRVRNGGPGGNLRRRFAGWMVRGELIVTFGAPVPAGDTWRLGVEVGERRLEPVDLAADATEVRVVLPEDTAGQEPVYLRIAVEGPGAALTIESLKIETPEGIVYP